MTELISTILIACGNTSRWSFWHHGDDLSYTRWYVNS